MVLPAHPFVKALDREPLGPLFALHLVLHPAEAMSRLTLGMSPSPKGAREMCVGHWREKPFRQGLSSDVAKAPQLG
jgi:hypothetical protein